LCGLWELVQICFGWDSWFGVAGKDEIGEESVQGLYQIFISKFALTEGFSSTCSSNQNQVYVL
jgi:hypothetical protein